MVEEKKVASENKSTGPKKEGTDSSSESFLEKIRGNPWRVASFVLGILLVGVLAFGGQPSDTSVNIASEQQVREDVMDFLNSRVDGGVQFVSIQEEKGLYKLDLSYQGDLLPVYATLDGENLVLDLVPLDAPLPDANADSSGLDASNSDDGLSNGPQ